MARVLSLGGLAAGAAAACALQIHVVRTWDDEDKMAAGTG